MTTETKAPEGTPATPQTAPASEATPAEAKNPFVFKICTGCEQKVAHGYLWNTETTELMQFPVTIASVRATRWMMDQMNISDAHKAELVEQAISAGLAEEVEGDLESVEYLLDRFFADQQLIEMVSGL